LESDLVNNLAPLARYQSYVLRLRWVVGQRGDEVCQAMVQSIASNETKYFHDLQALMSYLKDQAGDVAFARPSEG
jgi:hypothetical protein